VELFTRNWAKQPKRAQERFKKTPTKTKFAKRKVGPWANRVWRGHERKVLVFPGKRKQVVPLAKKRNLGGGPQGFVKPRGAKGEGGPRLSQFGPSVGRHCVGVRNEKSRAKRNCLQNGTRGKTRV